jgi:peptidoglycan hydrolase CwlO-like protein
VFDYTQYAKQYSDLDVTADIKMAWKLKCDILELQHKRSFTEKSHNKKKKSMKELSTEIKSLTSRLNTFSKTSGLLPQKRKRSVEDTDEGG